MAVNLTLESLKNAKAMLDEFDPRDSILCSTVGSLKMLEMAIENETSPSRGALGFGSFYGLEIISWDVLRGGEYYLGEGKKLRKMMLMVDNMISRGFDRDKAMEIAKKLL